MSGESAGWDLAHTEEVRVFSFLRRVQKPEEISRRKTVPILVLQPRTCPLSCTHRLSRGSMDTWGQGTAGWCHSALG